MAETGRGRRTDFRLAHDGAALLVLPFVVLACGPIEDARPAAFSLRDSAGIAIVESRRPLWAPGEEWRVAEEPFVSIGTIDGPPETQLFGVVGATRLSDGRIVVANGGTSSIRIYDARGGYVEELGREGEGPGEFARLGALHRFGGDSLLVFDSRLQRLSVFDAGGRFVRAFGLGPMVAIPGFPLDGGRLVASTRDLVPRDRLRAGVNRDSTTVVTFSMEGVVLDTVGRFPTPETYIHVEGPRIVLVPYPFARRVVLARFGGGFYYGSSDAWEIRAYRPDGTVARILRRTDAMRPATREVRDRFIRAVLADAPDEARRQELERVYAGMAFREVLPTFVDAVADGERGLWVEAYAGPEAAATEWDVFDREGRWLGSVATPPELRIREIGPDYVLGIAEDELGVQSVRLHRLTRGPA